MPGAVGAAVKVTVAVPVPAACSGRSTPATGNAQVAVALVGVDWGWVTVIVSPTRQFGWVTLYEAPAVGTAGVSVAACAAPATVVVVAPATVVVVVPAKVVVVVLVVVVPPVVAGAYVKLFGPAPETAAIVTLVAQYLTF